MFSQFMCLGYRQLFTFIMFLKTQIMMQIILYQHQKKDQEPPYGGTLWVAQL